MERGNCSALGMGMDTRGHAPKQRKGPAPGCVCVGGELLLPGWGEVLATLKGPGIHLGMGHR